MAGMRMLLAGGNAFDAMVAAGSGRRRRGAHRLLLTLAAEGVFMLYDSASGDLLALSGQGTAPGKATADFLPIPRPRAHPHRPRQGRPPVLHPPRHRGCLHLDAGTLRYQGAVGGNRAGHQLRRKRHPQLRIHAGPFAFPVGTGTVRQLPPRRLGRVLRRPAGSRTRLAADPSPGLANTLKNHARRLCSGFRRPLRPDAGRPGRFLPRPHRETDRRFLRIRRRNLYHGRPRRLPQPI